MKSTTFALAALMASVAIAQPHRQHMAKHHKRHEEIVWVTDYDYVTETAKVTTTIWVSEGFVVPTEAAAIPTTESSAAPSQSYAANQFFENASKEAKPTSTSVYVAPTPESTYVAPAPSSTYVAPIPSPEPEPTSTYVAPAPVVQSSTYVAPAVVETPSPAVVYTPEPVAATTAAAPAAASTYSSSSSGGVCSSASPCEGDITYYDAGLGACGETTDGSVDKVIALPVGMMGAQSNGNPYCGKTVTIKKGSKTTTATVVDKCMGCKGNSIDLSNAAFLELAEFDVGRTTATWWFN
ncbi:RlpA-like double-psi beta-barrel-protein domain-containing protein-containing protein [Leptodontidium sp. MPI-SDFR-AT-0119]|nr:RlpA-like double-psi beta-barrel-protein domain-containing protein-containing protein [Leptodontidium sp. MPI-SDFR-AT-0119]